MKRRPLFFSSHPLLSLAIGVLFLQSTGCEKEHFFDFTKSTGKTVTQLRDCPAFDRLEVKDNVNVIIHTDTVFFLKVTAGQHIVDGITTEVNDGVLTIRNENRSNWVRSFRNTYTVELGSDKIDQISYHGSGTVLSTDTIHGTEFTFDCWNGSGSIRLLLACDQTHLNIHNGRCDLTVAGNSDVTYYYLNDTGIIDGSALHSAFSYARNKGTGLLRLHAEKELGVEILHTGAISYRGSPYRIDQVVRGSGRLIKE